MWTGDLVKDMVEYLPNLLGDYAYIYNKLLADINDFSRIKNECKYIWSLNNIIGLNYFQN